ncbi:hypothetical protein DICPUDRAFT_152036 [Dictyostelium purpureum]|uniref:Geranylgeranyl transferase type-2 subunit beta n=1 Tax=Dictyostelium purpureum TaxID=5786 RepID=F0ZKB2_DICPU|nr:uncharacterized protein DICPUDRAFT_152036 [Dictyostelium purpureum]EGC35627.1 hypothetical protein DICPUDRAFT_152036 [Dictyostelium purpureum]|eukprot:XP_003287864.1 hypothetical protein DICPUDRAFT_152036 [Dictyostelium purpureum]
MTDTATTTTNEIDHTTTFLKDKHINYITNLDVKKDTFEYWVTEHIRMNGMYWGLTSLNLLGALEKMDKEEIIQWILSCQKPNGGFSGNTLHDDHLLSTLSAIQILVQLDSLDRIDINPVIEYIVKLQQEDGSFFGDQWGEIDTRFSYVAILTLSLLGALDRINVNKAVEFIDRCKNFDGGFGSIPGAESHAGQIFTCVSALALVNRLDLVDIDKLGWWLCERQLPNGGLNGRPEKSSDVCYSWWVISSLCTIDRLNWINTEKLKNYILKCQDNETGGVADKPGDIPDVFHTYFGISGFSLMGQFTDQVETIDPVYALPIKTIKKLGLKAPWNKLI